MVYFEAKMHPVKSQFPPDLLAVYQGITSKEKEGERI